MDTKRFIPGCVLLINWTNLNTFNKLSELFAIRKSQINEITKNWEVGLEGETQQRLYDVRMMHCTMLIGTIEIYVIALVDWFY